MTQTTETSAGTQGSPPADTTTETAGGNAGGGQPGGAEGSPSPYVPAHLPQEFLKPFLGKSNEETIDQMAKALKGFREAQSKQEPVPEKPDGYKPEWADNVKGLVADLGDDALFKEAIAAAHAAGLTNTQFNKLFNGLFGAMMTMDIIEKPVNVEEEKMKLAPPEARDLPAKERDAAIQRRVETNMAYVETLAGDGLDKEAAEALKIELAAFPALNALVELMRQPGTQPATGGRQPQGVTQDVIDQRMQDPRSRWGDPKYDPSFVQETDKMMRQLYGE